MGNSQFVVARDLFVSDFGLPTIAALLCCPVVFLPRDPGLLFLPRRRLAASDESAVTLLLDIDVGPCLSGRTTGLII